MMIFIKKLLLSEQLLLFYYKPLISLFMISAPRDLIFYVVHTLKYSNECAPPPKKTLMGADLLLYPLTLIQTLIYAMKPAKSGITLSLFDRNLERLVCEGC